MWDTQAKVNCTAEFELRSSPEKMVPFFLPIHALDIDLILGRILQHLPTKDLLTCALVNKLWNKHSRQILRSERQCLARIKAHCSCCGSCDDDLKILRDFENCENIPFNGLSFTIEVRDFRRVCTCILCSDFPRLVEDFLDRFPVKYLRIRWSEDNGHPGVRLLKMAFQMKWMEIEELIVEDLPVILSLADYFPSQVNTLIRLKTIVFPPVTFGASLVPPMSQLILAAGQLEEIKGLVYPEDVECLKDKLACVRNFCLQPSHANDMIYRSFQLAPVQLKSLTVNARFINGYGSPHRFMEILKILLRSSRDSLEVLRIELGILLEIGQSGNLLLPLTRLESMQVDYGSAGDIAALNTIEFSNLFPRMTHVCLSNTGPLPSLVDYPVRVNYNEEDQVERGWNSSVTHLQVCPGVLQKFPFEAMNGFFTTFRNVRRYTAKRVGNIADQFENLQSFCPDVESITFVLRPHELQSNLDWLLCGINYTEWLRIVEEGAEWLEKYEYVPVRPAIVSFRNLKHFRLEILHESCWCQSGEDKYVVLSQVAVQLAFRRMPKLTVEVHREICDCEDFPCKYILDHLKPDVKMMSGCGRGSFLK